MGSSFLSRKNRKLYFGKEVKALNGKSNIVKIVGLAAMALGGLATMIGNWAQEQAIDQMIDEKLEKALAERNQNEES